jgi:hypothetical protein
MLAAQQLNKQNMPIYGCTVLGDKWHFLVLKDNQYSISNSYIVTQSDDIQDIVRILKALKTKIEWFVANYEF